MVEAQATGRYVRTSVQKAGLVLDVIRGRDVNHALAALRFARKRVAKHIEKVLRSAIANAQQKDGFSGDVEQLVVSACYANEGPSVKRVRPAPMGRAFQIVKRMAHLTVHVRERVAAAPVETVTDDEPATETETPVRARKRAARKPVVKRNAKTAKKTTKSRH